MKELGEYTEQFRSMIATNLFGFWIADATGKLLDVNGTYCRMSGYSREELLQLSVPDLEITESAEEIARHMEHLITAGTDHFESRHRAKDGRIYDVEINTSYLRSQGKIIALFRDISDRKQAEEALRKTNEYLDNLFSYASAPIIVWDYNFTITRFNRAFETLTGRPSGEIIGGHLAILFPHDQIESSLDLITNTHAGERWESVEIPVMHIDGSTRIVLWNSATIFEADGITPVATIAQGIDITERKQIENELRLAKASADAANQAKSAFLATMSHEIRTPLSALLGNIELLASSRLAPQQQEYLNDCQTASRMLLNVINDVLDFSKIEAGKLELINEAFSVSSTAREVVRIFAASAEQKGLELSVSLAGDLPAYISGDQHRLRQIISNLLSNAIKFTSSGTISLEISREQPSSSPGPDTAVLSISVRDTGMGIPPDKQVTIFDSFTQVETFITRRNAGTGLGLAICRRLAETMGGAISLKSALGEGSIFTLSLPVTVCRPQQQVRANRAKAPVATARNILLADDEELGRTVTATLLRRRGHLVTVVENGAALLEALQRQLFDVVLSDISMPDMDGMEVARIIRSGERAGIDTMIPIIAMTAHAFAQDREQFLASGINDYTPKPVNFEELLCQIEDLCSK